MKRMKMIFLSLFYLVCATTSGRELKKMFCHNGGTITDRIVCYFDQKPSIADEKKLVSGQVEQVLSIPCQVVLDADVQKVIQKINTHKHPHYTVVIDQDGKKGLRITMRYNPEKVLCNYDVKESISEYQSLIITFHQKEVLETLKFEHDKILKQVNCLPQKKIMVDCGHGGKDEGKIGVNKISEKDINLSIGKHVEKILRQRGYSVELTRNKDQYIPLDDRTCLSNKTKADIFISLHANGASNANVSGIETYWTAHAPFSKKFFTQHKNLQICMEFHDQASKLLANHIHQQVITIASNYYPAKNRQVKESVSQVLLGTQMPAALIELGFLSNHLEARWLALPQYQEKLAYGICSGIDNYFKDIKQYHLTC